MRGWCHIVLGLTLAGLAASGLAAGGPATNELAAVEPTHPEPRLKVGDPAPAFKVNHWIQGAPIRTLEKDHAYLVMFWASDCGSCHGVLPHVQALVTQYQDRGLVVIGMAMESDPAKLQAFVRKQGARLTYPVAMDDERWTMRNTWLYAVNTNYIPRAILVGKDGRIAWIGRPNQLDKALLERVLAGPATTPPPPHAPGP